MGRLERNSGACQKAEQAICPVSVVIPCFRCSKTIHRAVTSVVRQSRPPAELILVDDASDDETLDLLWHLSNSYSWITVLALNENKGAASARNAGWAIASQPYVAFLDADDAWHHKKLEIQAEWMLRHPEVQLTGHLCTCLPDETRMPGIADSVYSTQISSCSLLFRNCFSTPSVMLKNDNEFRFLEGRRWSEDLFLWQQIAFAGKQIVRLELPLAYLFKAPYGQSGLSSELWNMEMGELDNLQRLYNAGHINLWLMVLISMFSYAKYIRRVLIVTLLKLLAPLRRA